MSSIFMLFPHAKVITFYYDCGKSLIVIVTVGLPSLRHKSTGTVS